MIKKFTLIFCFIISFFSTNIFSQIGTDLGGPFTIQLPCGANCTNLSFKVPDLKSTEDYIIQNIPYTPSTWTTTTGNEVTSVYSDDEFSIALNLPFKFCMYGSTFNQFIIGSNGVIAFDLTLAGCRNGYTVPNDIPFEGTAPCTNQTGPRYPKYSVMSPYHDIDPSVTSTAPNRKIEWRIDGVTPNRKLVVSFYKIAMFSCTSTIATSQIVINERTGKIDVFIENKPICSTWQSGRAILGIQKDATKALPVPGHNATSGSWSESNTGYRFKPNGPTTLLQNVTIKKKNGTLVGNGVIGATANDSTNISYNNYCLPASASSDTLVITANYNSCTGDPADAFSYVDTIYVIKNNVNLLATATTTPATCLSSNGTITITVPAGSGTAPYQYSINGGSYQSSNVFTGLATGTYSISIKDATAICSSTISVNVGLTNPVTATYTSTLPTCSTATNGTVTVTALNTTAPVTYSINGAAAQSSNIFTSLAAGTYSVVISDANGCNKSIFVTVGAGSGFITATISSTAASCTGSPTGTITVTPTTGTAPYQYSIGSGAYQSSNVFTGLTNGVYTVHLKDVNGCSNAYGVIISAGTGITATSTTTPTGCTTSTGSITVTPSSGTAPYQYAIDGGANQTSNIFTNVGSGLHSIKVTDFSGCTVTISATVTAGTSITATSTSTTSGCTTSTGTITVTPTSGLSPYQYAIDGGTNQASNIFTNVGSGLHSIKVTDAGGCSVTISSTVNAGSVTASAINTPTSCSGASNGTITVTASSGILPYQYAIDGGANQASNIFTNLSSGLHSIKVTDAGGCNVTISSTISFGANIIATSSTTATSCIGVNNGSITVTPTTGTAPYQYSIDGGTNQSSNIFTNTSAGAHSIIVTDNNGCNVTISATVNIGTGITASSTTTATSCTGVNNGSITVTPTTGTAPYRYSIDGGANQLSNIFTNTSAGMHSIIVTDNNGCNVTISATVNTGAGIAATSSTIASSCTGVNNGSITVTPTTGTAPYQYSIDGGANQLSNIFTNLSSGVHSILVTDNNGCNVTISATVGTGAGIAATLATTNATCTVALNGSITATPSNGITPYTFSVDGGSFGISNIFNGLSTGLHTINIKDAIGCTNSVSATISADPIFTISQTTTNTSCTNATNGTATISVSGGVAPLKYAIDGGTLQLSNLFNNLSTGSHTVLVSDAQNCTNSITFNVAANSGITATSTITNTLCNGNANGQILVTPNLGTAPYQYQLNGGSIQLSNIFPNLNANTYNINITDANNCNTSINATVVEPTLLTATISTTLVLCNSQSNGIINISANGGTAPYQYSIDNGITFSSNNTFNVAAGAYSIIIKDNNLCTKAYSTTITQPNPLSLSGISTNASCNGGADGTITLTANGGTVPFTYSIDGGVTFQNNNLFNVLQGSYTLTAKDANGCTKITTVNVGVTSNILVKTINDTTICEGSSDTLKTISNALSFSWLPITGLSSSTIQNPVAAPTTTTQYIVTATLGSCTKNDTVVVNVNAAPIPNAGPSTTICYGKSYTLQGSGGTQYLWTPINTLVGSNTSSPIATPTTTTIYSLNVIDANGCSSLVPDTAVVVITPPIVASAGVDTTIVQGQPYMLNATGATFFAWSPAFGLDNANIQNPTATIFADQTYNVEVSTAEGCKGNASVHLKVFLGPAIYVPTGFSPNGDGVNDVFKVTTVGIKQFDFLRVFNRWGQIIFETKNPANGWIGKFKSTDQPNGTYIYMVQGVTDKGKTIFKKGSLMLLR